MLRRIIFSVMILAAAGTLPTDFAIAQEPQVIHFQGMLTGPDGNPLRTDIYEVEFSIWEHATNDFEPLWSEIQMVETTDGLFDVFLGSADLALSADVFNDDDNDGTHLQVQVVGDDPMTPRIQMGKTPNSFVSSRVLGDIVTGPGSFRMAHPPEGPGVEMIADEIANSINFRLVHPPEQPTVDILSDAAQTSLKMMDPGDDKVGFEVLTGPEGNSMKLIDPGDDEVPVAEIIAEAAQTSFRLIDPGDDEMGFEVLIGAEGNSIKLMDPADEGGIVEISAIGAGPSTGASFKMFNPQPEPPATDPVIEIKTMPNDAGYFAMNNLSGAEVGPLLEMTTDPTASSRIKIHAAQPTFSGRVEIQAQFTDGANMTMFREGLVPHNEIKAMDLRVGSDIGAELVIFNYASDVEQELLAISGSPSSGASFRMFNPQPEPPADPLLEMNTTQYGANFAMAAPQAGGLGTDITDPMFEIITDSDGGSISLFDDVGKYMGFDPMLSTPGGAFYMDDPSTEQTNVWIESSGRVSARKGLFGYNNINDGNYNLAVGESNIATGDNCFAGGRVAEANHDNCFVWSDYPVGPSVLPTQTSGDNQFLVRATGGAAFFSNANFTSGVALGPGESSWSSIIPPRPMLNVRPVDGQEILNKIERLPINHYSHKDQDNGIEYIGPMPEDFNQLFGLGQDDEHISMLDPSGVALAGVQALLDRIEQLENRIAELEAERR